MPSGAREIIGDRGEDVLAPVPDVATAIVVVAHGELQIARGHELALAHGACPGAQHVLRTDPALVDDLDCRHQLLAEIGAAAAVVSERGERGDLGKIAAALAVIALDTPERHDEAGLHAEAPRDLLEQRSVLAEPLSALLHARLRYHEMDVLLEGERGLGLMPVEFQNTVDLVHTRERLRHRLRTQPLANRLLAHPRKPSPEVDLGGVSGIGPQRQREQRTKCNDQDPATTRHSTTEPTDTTSEPC